MARIVMTKYDTIYEVTKLISRLNKLDDNTFENEEFISSMINAIEFANYIIETKGEKSNG